MQERRQGPARVAATRKIAAGALALMIFSYPTVALADRPFSDPAGDNTHALDINSVSVSESPERVLTVSVNVANRQTLPPGSTIELWFDLDNDLETGDEGDEALARYFASGALNFFRWNGSDLVRRPATRMTASFTAGVLTYTAPKSAFDNVPSFGVLVISVATQEFEEEEIEARDAVPEQGRVAYSSPGPATLADPQGDVPRAPDIKTVKVSDAEDGMIRFAISAPSHRFVPPQATVVIAIDRDLLGEDSVSGKADVLLTYTRDKRDRLLLERWDPFEEEWVEDRPPTRARATGTGNGVVIVEVHRSELDDVARFGFAIESWEEDEDGDIVALDVAPDNLIWKYRLSNKPLLRLIAGDVSGEPDRPLAGKQFRIKLPVRRSDTSRGITSGLVTCNVIAAGQKVLARGRIRAGIATCTLLVPRNAVGVRGSMTVRSARLSVTAWFAGAIDFGGGVQG